MKKLDLPRADLLRMTASCVFAELRDGCRRQIDMLDLAEWDEGTSLGEDGLDLDSLELLAVAGRVNQLFHLHEAGIEDYLLRDRTLGQWSKIVKASLESAGERLTFLTSGSTGDPKPCMHDVLRLDQEVEAFAPLFADRTRIICCVPPHHIYGFLFTVLLPHRLGIRVLDGRFLSPGELRNSLEAGDLIVSSPSFWHYLSCSLPAYPTGVKGVTSTAPMPASLARTLIDQGLDQLFEIYGSSETAGVGWRTDPSEPFALLGHWHPLDDGRIERQEPNGSTAFIMEPMDLIIWDPPAVQTQHGIAIENGMGQAARTFRIAGRRDSALQVGGTNVFPSRIASVICDHDLVARCTVRLAQNKGIDRLKAHIVLRDGIEASPAVVRDIEQWCRDHLKMAERPRVLCFTDRLPTDEERASNADADASITVDASLTNGQRLSMAG